MLNRIRTLRSSRHDHDASGPNRADLQIRNLLDSPELRAVMGPSVDAPGTSHQQTDEPVAA